MHKVHFLTLAKRDSKKGWVAPIEFPADQPQDGVLAVPVLDRSTNLFPNYQLEYSIYRGPGHYERSCCTMDLLDNGSLNVKIRGWSIRFIKQTMDGKPVLFDYIGQLAHNDFGASLCQIEPESENVLDELYEREQIFLTGCDPESEYGGLDTFLKSSVGQKMFG